MNSAPELVKLHGFGEAAYSSNGEKYMPYIDCLCGWSSRRCESWSIAGELFDEHLAEVRSE